MFNRIANKIIFSYAAVVGLLVIVLFFFVKGLIYNANLDVLKREMDEKVSFIDLVLKESASSGIENPKALLAEVHAISKIVNLRVTLISFEGLVIADSDVSDAGSMDNHLHRAEIESALSAGKGNSIRRSSTLNVDTLYYAKKSDAFFIRVAKPLSEIESSISGTKNRLLIFLFFSAAAGIVFVFFIAHRMTKPIRETYLFAKEFAEGRYDRRIRNYSNDEVGSVQRALNKLADTVVEKMDGLVAERAKLVTTFETLSDGVAVILSDRTVEFANASFKNIFSPGLDVNGRRSFEVIRSRKINARIDEAVSSGKASRFEEEFSDGRVLELYLNPVTDGSKLGSILFVAHEITEQKKIERIKSDLVGNMSHELKTPITIMKGYLETLKNHLADPEMSSLLISRAIENADRQNSLINDILKLHMIESSTEVAVERIDLNEIAGSCIKILSAKASDRNVSLFIAESAPAVLEKGNRFLAEEVLFNIIDNAINYNRPQGTVTVSIAAKDGKTVCTVKDTGIGIPQESVDRIFERFYRVDKSRSRATGGTGLGLSIVKHAADLLGWRITVHSSEAGTEFRIAV